MSRLYLTQLEWYVIKTRPQYIEDDPSYTLARVELPEVSINGRARYKISVEFPNESARSLFLIRYSEYINEYKGRY